MDKLFIRKTRLEIADDLHIQILNMLGVLHHWSKYPTSTGEYELETGYLRDVIHHVEFLLGERDEIGEPIITGDCHGQGGDCDRCAFGGTPRRYKEGRN